MTIGFTIAVALYVVTYLSFVRLLRYPRNWHAPSLAVSFTTAGLVAVTVTYIALSSDGIDPAMLLLSAAIIAVLFGIIAAPAIAFRPASRWIEFLARHGNYVGPFMLALAIGATFAIANIKLQGALAAAMAIELSWFLRLHRAGRRRQLYPLNDRGLAVLQIQAKGNLKAFRRRHGIRELVLSKDETIWTPITQVSLIFHVVTT